MRVRKLVFGGRLFPDGLPGGRDRSGIAGARNGAHPSHERPRSEVCCAERRGYAVNSPTQVKNFLGQFSIRSDWGEIDASGGVLLAIRVVEMPALAELDKVTHTKVFADAIAESAGKAINGVVRVASDPVGTITGIPAGVGRLFARTAGMVSGAASAIAASVQRARMAARGRTGPPQPISRRSSPD